MNPTETPTPPQEAKPDRPTLGAFDPSIYEKKPPSKSLVAVLVTLQVLASLLAFFAAYRSYQGKSGQLFGIAAFFCFMLAVAISKFSRD